MSPTASWREALKIFRPAVQAHRGRGPRVPRPLFRSRVTQLLQKSLNVPRESCPSSSIERQQWMVHLGTSIREALTHLHRERHSFSNANLSNLIFKIGEPCERSTGISLRNDPINTLASLSRPLTTTRCAGGYMPCLPVGINVAASGQGNEADSVAQSHRTILPSTSIVALQPAEKI